jgi:hypothetical protein
MSAAALAHRGVNFCCIYPSLGIILTGVKMNSRTDNRSFGLEREMSGPVLRWLVRQKLIAKPEFRTPWGICDFVCVEFNPAKIAERLALGQKQPIGTVLRVSLLNAIPEHKDGISLQALHGHYADLLSLSELEREISVLQKGNFIASPSPGRFQKLNGWAPLHNRIVAVEMKLSRIDEALAQAQSHLAFATESYVALPSKTAKSLMSGPRTSAFQECGVGVLSVSRSRCELLLTSKNTRQPDPVLQMHCAERFWRTSITNSAS